MARYRAGIATRERIIDATRELLGEAGLEGTTLKAICDRAGVRSGSFYNLFDSKEEAILEVVREAIAAVDPDPTGIGSDTVSELVHAYVKFIVGEPSLASIYLQIAVSGGLTDEALGKRVLRHHQRRLDRFSDALVREQPYLDQDEARTRAEALLAALHGLAYLWFLDPTLDYPQHAERLLLGLTVT